jgi:hypothetical protein
MRLGTSNRELVELASGFDALYLTASCVLPGRFIDDLQAAQRLARETSEPVPLVLGSESFMVGERGLNRYRYSLSHPHGVLAFTQSEKLPPVYVQPRARFIHAVGIEAAQNWFVEQVESVVGAASWKVSRADLFMDSHGWDLRAEDRARFLCQARDVRVWERDGVLTGLGFGSGKSLSARIYDKTEEVHAKGTDWWPVIWGPNYRQSERVLRVEFQLRRSVIRELGLDTPAEVLQDSERIWAYLTKWLSFRDVTADKTISRRPVSWEWEAVCAAYLGGAAVGLDRVYAGEMAGSMRRLLPPLRGYLANAGAVVGATSLDETLHRVGRIISDDAERTGVSFEQRLAEKSAALGLAS